MTGASEKSPVSPAFTIVEMVIVLAIIGLLATTAFQVFNSIPKSTERLKLKSDMTVLNSALKVYLASGGQVDRADSADDVIRKLVSVTNSKYAHLVPGLSGSFVDPRIMPVYQEKDEASTAVPRVVWNEDSKRFEMIEGGEPGIKKFILHESMAYVSEEEERRFVFLYSDKENWIWEYNGEDTEVAYDGPSIIGTTPVEGDSVPLIPNLEEPEPHGPTETLLPPVYSMPGGFYDCTDFDIVLDLTNPNEGINSEIYYRRDYGSWVKYESSLTITPDTVIESQVVADHYGYTSSEVRTEHFNLKTIKLAKPLISVSVEIEDSVYVALEINGPSGIPGVQVEYRVAGGEWEEYEEPFNVGVTSLLSTFLVEARIVSTDNHCYEDSDLLSLTVDVADMLDLSDLPVLDLPIGISLGL